MKLARPWLGAELEQLHPLARAVLESLEAWVRQQGWEELLLVEVLSEADDWSRSGCSWAVRLRVYNRGQRQAILNRLRHGARVTERRVKEDGDLARCTILDFPWREERLAQRGEHGCESAVRAPLRATGSD